MLGGLPVLLKLLLMASMLIRQASVGAALIRRPARSLLFLVLSNQVRFRLGWQTDGCDYLRCFGPGRLRTRTSKDDASSQLTFHLDHSMPAGH